MKKLVLSLLLLATVVLSVNARVYSENVIRYAIKAFPAGFTMVANPQDFEDNTVKKLFGISPPTMTIYKYDGNF